MMRSRGSKRLLRKDFRDRPLDILELITTPRQEAEQSATKYQWLEIAHLRELLPRHTLSVFPHVNFFICEYLLERQLRYALGDSLPTKILCHPAR